MAKKARLPEGKKSRVRTTKAAKKKGVVGRSGKTKRTAKRARITSEEKEALARMKEGLRGSKEKVSHAVVIARAGTGKTFTLVQGLYRMLGQDGGFRGTPSPQQQEIWDLMCKGPRPHNIHVCAFNKSIERELAQKVPSPYTVSTIHSLGNGCVRRAYGKVNMNKWKYRNVIEEIEGRDYRELAKHEGPTYQAVQKLVDMARLTLAGWDRNGGFDVAGIDEDCLDELCNQYDIETNGDQQKIYELVPRVLEAYRDMGEGKEFDYADMIWLPIVNDLAVPKFEMVVVDEAQDLNACQQALVLKAGDRVIACGDDRQAIYGFAGADTDSINHFIRYLEERDSRGVTTLPLTTTYRCGKRIVELAQVIVKDYNAYHENPDGEIVSQSYDEVLESAQSGDMVICRVNAPMVGMAFRFIRMGKKATIKGNDIGEGLVRLIKKLKAKDVGDLLEKIDEWYHGEGKKLAKRRNPSEAALIALQDKRDCILAFCDDILPTCEVGDVIKRIEAMFVKDQSEGIKLSSIHRAKGLEADVVHILQPDLLPHPMAKTEWQVGQEYNLKYVAITRAIKRLVWIRS